MTNWIVAGVAAYLFGAYQLACWLGRHIARHQPTDDDE